MNKIFKTFPIVLGRLYRTLNSDIACFKKDDIFIVQRTSDPGVDYVYFIVSEDLKSAKFKAAVVETEMLKILHRIVFRPLYVEGIEDKIDKSILEDCCWTLPDLTESDELKKFKPKEAGTGKTKINILGTKYEYNIVYNVVRNHFSPSSIKEGDKIKFINDGYNRIMSAGKTDMLLLSFADKMEFVNFINENLILSEVDEYFEKILKCFKIKDFKHNNSSKILVGGHEVCIGDVISFGAARKDFPILINNKPIDYCVFTETAAEKFLENFETEILNIIEESKIDFKIEPIQNKGSDILSIERWKLETIENALRMAMNINCTNSPNRVQTAFDRELLLADKFAKEILKDKPSKSKVKWEQ